MRAAWLGGKEPTRDHVVLQSYTGILAIVQGQWKLVLGTERLWRTSGCHSGVGAQPERLGSNPCDHDRAAL